MALTTKQRLFVNAYLSNGFNALKAAQSAGFSDPVANAYRVKSEPEVAAEIKKRLDEQAMTAEEVLAGLSSIARSSPAELFRNQDTYPVLDITVAFENGAIHNVKKFSKNQFGPVVEMYDKQAALTTLAKAHGLLDKLPPAEPEDTATDDDILGLAAEIHAKRARLAAGGGGEASGASDDS